MVSPLNIGAVFKFVAVNQRAHNFFFCIPFMIVKDFVGSTELQSKRRLSTAHKVAHYCDLYKKKSEISFFSYIFLLFHL